MARRPDASKVTPRELFELFALAFGRATTLTPEDAQRLSKMRGGTLRPAPVARVDLLRGPDGISPTRELLPPLFAAIENLPSARGGQHPNLISLRWRVDDEEWETSFDTQWRTKRVRRARKPTVSSIAGPETTRELVAGNFWRLLYELEKLRDMAVAEKAVRSVVAQRFFHLAPTIISRRKAEIVVRRCCTSSVTTIATRVAKIEAGTFNPRALTREILAAHYGCKEGSVGTWAYRHRPSWAQAASMSI
jgi:hypothetical protein